ncbi:hypothetical protein MMC14_005463 [Varicellaria rhodocarpa]|nr:hypothetical protein [Varicellaria rhodocarpa]
MAMTLMNLPFEVRNLIWEALFPIQWDDYGKRKIIRLMILPEIHPTKHVHLTHKDDGVDWNDELCTTLHTNIIHCNRQISQEVTPFIYGRQTFQIEHYGIDVLCWLNSIGISNTRSIRQLQLDEGPVCTYHNRETIGNGRTQVSEVLECLPQLRSLAFQYDIRGELGEDEELGSRVIAAIHGMVNLEYLSLNAMSHQLHSIRSLTGHKRQLRYLELNGRCIRPIKDDKEMKGIFEDLPCLKHLRLEHFLNFSNNSVGRRKFFEYIAPLECLEYAGTYIPEFRANSLTSRHGSTLRFLKLCLEDRLEEDEPDPRRYSDLLRLFDNLPILEILKLRSYSLSTAVLSILPPSLEAAAVETLDRSERDMGADLQSLKARCPTLKHLRLTSHSQCASSPGFHPEVENLRANGGIEVESVSCIIEDCRGLRGFGSLDSYVRLIYQINHLDFENAPTRRLIGDGRPWRKMPNYDEYVAEIGRRGPRGVVRRWWENMWLRT